MGKSLNAALIAKYAARLQGKRLLPVLRPWQLRRAISLLAADGSQASLDAIKHGLHTGLLGKPPYLALLETILSADISPADAERVRSYLQDSQLARQVETRPYSESLSNPSSAAPKQPLSQTRHNSYSKTEILGRLLNQPMPISTSADSYLAELRNRVHQDDSRMLLQEICELWDRVDGVEKELLRELIQLINLAPDNPLWLRCNVALDCAMPSQLAHDGPAIAQYLVEPIQLRTRKESLLSAIRKLRREDTKAKICELWFKQYKQGGHNEDFDDVILNLDFLPQRPLEQRVAIALTFGWADRLAFDSKETVEHLLPLINDQHLANEARRALEKINHQSAHKALKDLNPFQIEAEGNQYYLETTELSTSHITETKVVEDEITTSLDEETPSDDSITNDISLYRSDLATGAPDLMITASQDRTHNLNEGKHSSSQKGCQRQAYKSYLDYRLDARSNREGDDAPLSIVESKHEDKHELAWASRLDHFLNSLHRQGLTIKAIDDYIIVSYLMIEREVILAQIDIARLVEMPEDDLDSFISDCTRCYRSDSELAVLKQLIEERQFKHEEAIDSTLPSESWNEQAGTDTASALLVSCAADLLSHKEIADYLSPYSALIAGLLTFYVRERDGEIERYKECMMMNDLSLFNESDCLAGATLGSASTYASSKIAATYSFDPQQSFRFATLRDNRTIKMISRSTLITLELISIDLIEGVATVIVESEHKSKLSPKDSFIYIPQDFSASLRQSLAQQASAWISGNTQIPKAFNYLLRRTRSEEVGFLNHDIDQNPSRIDAYISSFLRNASGISLILQGPPGSGKTTCAASIILQLAESGLRIGVSANSHLAINNLMEKVSLSADLLGSSIKQAKIQYKVGKEERKRFSELNIRPVSRASKNMSYDIYGGTPHEFSKALYEGQFDLLVVDEASQVSLASLLAMARCANNILLVGDQQQLNQPMAVSHPGECGLSCLDYATSGYQVVPRDIGVFLSTSWRMHPNLCRFISTSFYQGRLKYHGPNDINQITSVSEQDLTREQSSAYLDISQNRRISVFERDAIDARIAKLRDSGVNISFTNGEWTELTGIKYMPVEHSNNHVFSEEEAETVAEIVDGLVGKHYLLNVYGQTILKTLDWNDIAIMAPFNAQVNLIQRVLGASARVGTVDRFQGQEAPVAIYSITTSSSENLNAVKFALNQNRINVALSRSQSISIVVGSSSLPWVLGNSPELAQEYQLFLQLTQPRMAGSPLILDQNPKSKSSSDNYKPADNAYVIGEVMSTPSETAPVSGQLEEPSEIELAKTLFGFDLRLRELIDLYRSRMFDELALFLRFCHIDNSLLLPDELSLWLRLAASPTATPQLLENLAVHANDVVAKTIAANPKAPPGLVKELVSKHGINARRGAAEHPLLSDEDYWDLFVRGDDLVAQALALNTGISDDLLARLKESDCADVRTNAHCSFESRHGCSNADILKRDEILDSCTADSSLNDESPLGKALSSSAKPEELSLLTDSQDQQIRIALASNPLLSEGDIRILAADPNDAVRCRLAMRLDLCPDITDKLAADHSRYVRLNVLQNPACTAEALALIGSKGDAVIRERVARHHKINEISCELLVSDSVQDVVLALVDNPHVPDTVFAKGRSRYYVNNIAGGRDPAFKALLLISKRCPVDAIRDVCISKHPEIRLAVALSPHSKVSALKALEGDKEAVISRIASRRIASLDSEK